MTPKQFVLAVHRVGADVVEEYGPFDTRAEAERWATAVRANATVPLRVVAVLEVGSEY